MLPLNKTIECPSIKIVARVIFYENNKYCPQVFLDEYLYETKEIDIKNSTCYYFDAIINVWDIDIDFSNI